MILHSDNIYTIQIANFTELFHINIVLFTTEIANQFDRI